MLHNVQTVKDMGTPKIIAISNCDVSNGAGDHLTNQCHRKEISSDVQCVFCGGNHPPANYKGRMVYKQTNSMVRVRERTIPTERPPLVGEVVANFCE
jgi:hypothetical protein